MCGLSLAELHTITGADDPALAQRTIMHLIAERGDSLDVDSLLRLERIWPVLEAAVIATGRLPLAQQTVERTWRSLGGDVSLTASELINARRYLQLLDELEAQSVSFDLSALQRKMTKLYAAPVIHPGAVDLLTIHKAKGLEWDVIIVPALERIAGSNRSRLLNWVELDPTPNPGADKAAHILLAPIQTKGEASTELNTWIASIHKRPRSRRAQAPLLRRLHPRPRRAPPLRRARSLFKGRTQPQIRQPPSIRMAGRPAALRGRTSRRPG